MALPIITFTHTTTNYYIHTYTHFICVYLCSHILLPIITFTHTHTSYVCICIPTVLKLASRFPALQVTYTIESDFFQIDTESGIITTLVVLDREANDSFTLTVIASDQGDPPLIATANITVDILDENDETPEFVGNITVFNIVEHAINGAYVGTVTAVDGDEEGLPNSEVSYSIVGGSGEAFFTIDLTSGNITVMDGARLDFEGNTTEYDIVVAAMDNGVPRRAANQTFTVVLLNADDNPPQFEQDEYYFSISEGNDPNAFIGSVRAVDDDMLNRTIGYAFNSTVSLFRIESNGSIYANAMFNRELDGPQYNVFVVAFHLDSPNTTQDTALVVISITDVNEDAVRIVSFTNTITIDENSAVDLQVGNITAEDTDPTSELSYQLTIALGLLRVDDTGRIFIAGMIDREDNLLFPENVNQCPANTDPSIGCLQFNVQVRDLTHRDVARASGIIFVQDLDDTPPQFMQAVYEITINESTGVLTDLPGLNIEATDADFGIVIEYFIPEEEEVTNFTIGQFSGLIVVAEELDFETITRYNFTIIAEDTNNNTDSATVIINILDVNDNAPVFDEPFYTKTIPEDLNIGSVVEIIHATDIDSGTNKDITYNITGGNEEGRFDIDPIFGEVTLSQPLNRENVAFYSLTIEAMDHGVPPQVNNVTLNITISDVNDHPPFFTTNASYGIVSETAREGDPVLDATTGLPLRLEAIDLDDGATVTIILFTFPGTPFTVDASTGNVTVSGGLDQDEQADYNFVAVAQDDTGLYSSVIQVFITVTGTNDHPPTFERDLYTLAIDENSMEGEVIITVVAEDQDLLDVVRYSLITNFNASELVYPEPGGGSGASSTSLNPDMDNIFPFELNNETGEISLLTLLDYEVRREWEFTVVATDSGNLTGTTNVTITVEDVNDNPPVFTEYVFRFYIPEDTNVSMVTPVSTIVNATDIDEISQANLRYFIVSGGEGEFEMDHTNGDLYLASPLDPTETKTYTIDIVVSDGRYDDTAKVVITVIDINDNVPAFDQPEYFAALLENATRNTFVVKITAEDDDLGILGNVMYRLVTDTSGLFYINEFSGEIFTNNTEEFDFDILPNEYLIVVEAYDGGLPSSRSSVNVTVSLEDVNDNVPLFDQPLAVSIPEDTNIEASVFRVTTTDADSGINREVQMFEILTPNASFTIESDTGVIRVAKELDYDPPNYQQQILLDIRVTDRGNPSLSSNDTLVVDITDSNDNAPYFEQPLYEVYVPENITILSTAFIVVARDIDSGENSRITYGILSEHTIPFECRNRFMINETTGHVALQESLNAEDSGQPCTLVMEATDNGVPQRSSQATYVVLVTDINENPPMFTGPLMASILENSPNMTSVLNITTTDLDGNIVSYSAVGGDTQFFRVSEDGHVTVAGDLDREVREVYYVTVEARDNGGPPMTSVANVTIILEDENDSPPEFPMPFYVASIRENQEINVPFLYVVASDDDTGPSLVYSLVLNAENETGYGLFDIDPKQGALLVVGSLDYDNADRIFYYLNVQANDSIRTDVAPVSIRVLESNDASPEYTNLPNTTNLPEDVGNDTLVFQANAIDIDQGVNGRVVYSLMPTAGSDSLRIDSETGDIFVNGDDQFDFEVGSNQFILMVVATDSAGEEVSGDNEAPRSSGFGNDSLFHPDDPKLSSVGQLIVTITDVNDEQPEFLMAEYNTFVIEHILVELPVITVSAFDRDAPNTNNSAVRYTIASGDMGNFKINSISGQITTSPPIDREEIPLYELVVVAFDLGVPSQSSSVIVNVDVIDTDDEQPVFIQTPYTGTVDENSPEGVTVATVTAFDPDTEGTDSESDIRYILFDSSGHFNITGTPGVILNSINGTIGVILTTDSPIDRERDQNFSLTVQVIDTQSRSDMAKVFIIVNDQNDERPIFEQSSYFFNISENTPVGGRILGIQATDRDVGENAVTLYELQLIAGRNDIFGVESLLSDIIVDSSLCFSDSAIQMYTFTMVARDALDPNLNDTTEVIIRVYKENAYPPEFAQPSYVSRLDRNAANGTVVLDSLQTIDLDICSGPPIYEIIDGNENVTFEIDANSGVITLTRDLTPDDLTFTLTVMATDTDNLHLPNLTSQVNVIILIGQLLPVTIAVENGLTVPTISRRSQLEYQQDIWLFDGGESQPIVRYFLGNLFEEMAVEVRPTPAISVEAALAQYVVYPDHPRVVVGLQVEGERFEKSNVEQTEVYIRVENSNGNVTATCITESPGSTCIASASIPSQWFNTPNTTAEVFYGISLGSSETSLGVISISAPAECLYPSDQEVRVTLPQRVVYPGEYIDVVVSASIIEEVHTYLLTFDLAEGLEFVHAYGPSEYIIQTATSGNKLAISGLNAEDLTITGNQEIVQIVLYLREDAPLITEDILIINCTVEYLVNAMEQQLLSSEPAVHINFNEDGSCNSTGGVLLTSPHSVVKLFPYASTPALLNSVVLNGEQVTDHITLLGLQNSGTFTNNISNVSCRSTDPNILKAMENCYLVYLNGSETTGSEKVFVDMESPLGSISIPYQVWYPRGIVVDPQNMELNPVADVFDMDSGCSQVYESTKIEVEARFESGDVREPVVITQLVLGRIYSSNEQVVRIDTDPSNPMNTVEAVGVGPGSAEIMVDLFGTTATVLVATVNVSSTSVTVNYISFSRHTSLMPLPVPPSTAGTPYRDTAVVSLVILTETEPQYINTPVDVLSEAVLSNGRNFELSGSHGLELRFTNPDVFLVSDPSYEIVVRGTGSGQLEGNLDSTCPGARNITSFDPVTILLDPITAINVTVVMTELASTTHADILGIPTSTTFEVQLVHADGTVVTVTDDPRISLNVSSDLISVDQSGTIEAISSSGGIAEFIVSYNLPNEPATSQTVGPIEVVNITELQLSTTPYPYYEGVLASDSPMLSKYAYTEEYQQVTVTLAAVLSNGNTRDVTDNATFFISDPSIVIMVGALITPIRPGNTTLTASLGGINTYINITVLDNEITVTQITEFSLPLTNETLSGILDASFIPMLTFGFSDGSVYPNFLSSEGPALSGLVQFSTSDPIVFPIDNETGIGTTRGNSVGAISITASVLNITASLSFYVDLLPNIGEVDIEGLFNEELEIGGNISVPVFLNAYGATVGALEVKIWFDPQSLALLDVDAGDDLPENIFIAASLIDETPGNVRFGAVMGDGLIGSSRMHVATLTFTVLNTSIGYFDIVVITMNEFAGVYTPIGDPTPRFSAPASQPVPPPHPLNTTQRCLNPPCSPDECLVITGYIPAADANADCVFDLVDGLFIQLYVTQLSLASSAGELSSQQLEAMDTDKSGRLELSDVIFLIEGRMGQYPLVADITLRPIDAQFSNCTLTINVTLQEWQGDPPQDAFAYFGLFHQNVSFQSEYDGTNLVLGVKNSTISRPNGAFGGWIEPLVLGNGQYVIQTDGDGIIAQTDIGFMLVYGTLDPVYGVPTPERTQILTGHPTPPVQYSGLDAVFQPVGAPGITLTLPPFNPQQLFGNTFRAELCYNNFPPVFVIPPGPLLATTRPEDVEINEILRSVQATDNDIGLPAGMIAYSLIDISQPGTLDINPQTGNIFVTGELDRESYDEVTATVVATDQGPHIYTRRNDTIFFALAVADVNDNPPEADNEFYTADVREDTVVPDGRESNPVFQFHGGDRDIDTENQGISAVNITAGDDPLSPFFNVSITSMDMQEGSRFTGSLTLLRSLDRETQDMYNLTLTIADAGTPPLYSDFQIQVTVTDANDMRPVFTSPEVATVSENRNPGTRVIQVQANDSDIGTNAEFIFQIVSVFEADDEGFDLTDATHLDGFFLIENTSGIIETARVLDREGLYSFRLIILAIEEGISIQDSARQSIWVMVCDENDEYPNFALEEYNASMVENSANGEPVIQLQADDGDLGPFCADGEDASQDQDNVVTYELVTPNIPFNIDRNSGTVYVNGPLDYENMTNYTMEIKATDLGVGPLSNTTRLIIYIEDENDNPPILSNDTYFNLAVENSTNGTVVVDFISATDADSGQNAVIRYSLTGIGSDDFYINPESGMIFVVQPLDREDQPVYELTVIAFDLGEPPLNDTATVIIEVVDINDEPPVFDQEDYFVTVSENTPLDTVILTVFAEDSDTVLSSIMYSFEGDIPELFDIDKDMGNITVAGLLCTTLPNVSYTFAVKAEDNPGGELRFSSTVNVTVVVVDENQFVPEFTKMEYATVVADGIESGQVILTVEATDRDVCSPPFTYSIQQSADASLFDINETTGVLMTDARLDQSSGELYTITVLAEDSGTPSPLVGNATVYVIVGETVPVDISTTHGYPVNNPRKVPDTSTYEQDFRYFYNLSRFDTIDTARVTFGPLAEEDSFDVTLLPATQLNALLLTPIVYHDNPNIQVALQALDQFGSIAVDRTEVFITAQYGSEMEYTNTTTGLFATAVLALTLPDRWFNFPNNETRNVTVSYGVVGQYATPFSDSTTLISLPQYEVECQGVVSSPLLVVQLPSYTLYNEQTAQFPVLAQSDVNANLSAVSIRCVVQPGLQFSEPPVTPGHGWEARYELDGGTLTLTASRITHYSTTTDFETVVNLSIDVTNVDQSLVGVTCSKLEAVDSSGNFASYSEVAVMDGTGCRAENGAVTLSQNVLIGAFPFSYQTVIFNDAILAGIVPQIFPEGAAVFLAAEPFFFTLGVIATDYSCSSEDENTLKAEVQFQNCVVYVDGTETRGSEAIYITFDASSFLSNSPAGDFIVAPSVFPVRLSFQVWYPDIPITMQPVDPILSPVENWNLNNQLTCSQAYQRTQLQATAIFRPSNASGYSAEVRVEHLLNLQNAMPSVAALSGSEIIGLSSGTATITATNNNIVIGATTVEVGSDPVRTVELDVVHSTGLTLSTPAVIHYSDSNVFQANLYPDLQYEGQTAYLVTTAVFSDGTRYRVPNELGLSYASLDQDIIQVSDDDFTAFNSGMGDLLQVNLTGCDGQTVISDISPLKIDLLPPEIRVTISPDVNLVHPSDKAASLVSRFATSVSVSVTLVYNLGEETIEFDITDNSVYELSPGGLLLMTDGTNGKILEPIVADTAAAINLTVSYKSYPSVTQVLYLIRTESLESFATPQPFANHSTLFTLGNSGVFQQAKIFTNLIIEEPLSSDLIPLDISGNPSIHYTASANGIVVVSQEGIVTPQAPGSIRIRTEFEGLISAVMFGITSEKITVESIDGLRLSSNDTLSGLPGTVSAILSTSVRFSDGAVFDEAYMQLVGGQVVPGLLLAVSNNPEIFSINSVTGE